MSNFTFTRVAVLGLFVLFQGNKIADVLRTQDLSQVVAGPRLQPVEWLSPSDLATNPIRYNMNLKGIEVKIPGWRSDDPLRSNARELLELFGVRTLNANSLRNNSDPYYFYAQGVGRSGMMEAARGVDYMRHRGVVYKGITLKGYGGNYGRGAQPNGSLEIGDPSRDFINSSILFEKGVDTYVGTLMIIRKDNDHANFVRLSRTAFRTNELIDNADKKKLVDHLTSQFESEVGKKMNASEFYDWYVTHSAKAIAAKDYLQFEHGSPYGADNFGIGELVDFGEGQFHGVATGSSNQKRVFKGHTMEAASSLEKEFQISAHADALFERTYTEQFNSMKKRDEDRIELNSATRSQLTQLRLSANAVNAILVAQGQRLGILTREEGMNIRGVTARDRELIWNGTRTEAITIQNGRVLPSVYLNTLGGGAEFRLLVTRIADTVKRNNTSGSQLDGLIKREVESALKAKDSVLFVEAFESSYDGSSPLTHLSRHIKQLIEWAKANNKL